jgi:hypothetical protein
MSKENRKRKRIVYHKALRAMATFNECIREMREISKDLAEDYGTVSRTAKRSALHVCEDLHLIEEAPLRAFCDLPEEL